MSVEFDENNINRPSFDEPTPTFASWLISHHVVKDVETANRIMVVGALIILIIAGFLFFK